VARDQGLVASSGAIITARGGWRARPS
jgi:hypothetical protein